MVHRDLKPANVMLAEDGPRVIDFGVSRAAESADADALTQTGRVMGTPPFMSPEQFTSPHEVDAATDVFSLGAVVTYAATRHGPFDSVSPWETATRVVDGTPDLDGVPDALLPFVRLCLEKHPKARPTPAELVRLVRDGRLPDRTRDTRSGPGGSSGSSGSSAPSGPAPSAADTGPAPRPPRRRRRAILVTAVAALAAGAGAGTLVLAPDGGGAPDALPAGWHAWHRQARNPRVKGSDVLPAEGPFSGCVSSGTSLVCAGDGVMAARFALADGRNTWSLPLDPTPSSSSGPAAGTIIGTRPGGVYVFGADDSELKPAKNQNAPGVRTHYTVQSIDAATGRALWRTPVSDNTDGTGPDTTGAVATPAGVITPYGDSFDSYALLDAAHGTVRWHHRLPYGPEDQGDCRLTGAGGQAYLVCHAVKADGAPDRTTIAQLDPATGKARWTRTAEGSVNLLGQAHRHLVLGTDPTAAKLTGLTLIDLASQIMTTVRLSVPSTASGGYLVRGTLYLTLTSGSVRAVDPATGRQLWESNSTVEQPGPPTASATRLYLASPNGRLAALDLRTGKVTGTLPGRDDSDSTGATDPLGAPVLSGDALYVPYGLRSVYSVDVKSL
ncbi:serine/threonine protein kinase [Streptomyces alanosinicus]|uniref:non-specific serine/threonine protein kinase n=1 Tax=Streptomyces alanosinicus TaxID=68171 RepID=A0A918YCG5_9ACTN|nr:serine/threonine protein kinase [Streptomyces alanosinicus]